MAAMAGMNHAERLATVFAGGVADRTPVLGGWIACPDHICALAGVTLQEYWQSPHEVSVRAYRVLQMDGLIDIFVPPATGDYRCVDASSYATAQKSFSLDEAVAKIDAMPTPEKLEESFDFAGEYQRFRDQLLRGQALCGDMVYMPARWSGGAKVSWYFDFGYENFFMLIGGYPKQAQKLMEVGGAQGRCQGRLVAKAVTEGLYPGAVLLGEDICSQRGPMISPDFMEKYYAPQLRYGLEPLLEAGCKPVWHCDGDVRPILDLIIDAGAQGLQGFQPECGMTIDYVAQRRTREGKPLLVFGPLSVTTELPVCKPQEIREKVRYAIDVCRGNADLVLFTANTINPDIPLENIVAMYEEARLV